MLNNALNLSFLLKNTNSAARQRSRNLQTLRQKRDGDGLHLGNLLHELIVAVLLENNSVVLLVTDLALGPLLLLLLGSRRRGGSQGLSGLGLLFLLGRLQIIPKRIRRLKTKAYL